MDITTENKNPAQASVKAEKTSDKRWYWLLLVPWFFALWVPSYNQIEPQVFGFPFFYWYQLVLVVGTGFVIGLVYHLSHGRFHGYQGDRS